MKTLLAFARVIDALNERCARVASWLTLAACLISCGNALVRYSFSASSNAWLEIQWYDERDLEEVEKERQHEHEDIDEDEEAGHAARQRSELMLDPQVAVHAAEHQAEHRGSRHPYLVTRGLCMSIARSWHEAVGRSAPPGVASP